MHYYLSYIEINGHVALMLSVQNSDAEPVKVTCELGFAPLLDSSQVGYFGVYKGRVGEETNVSRALYSLTSDVKHRTYEISKAEMEQFFHILNGDRRINSEKINSNDSFQVIKYDGGPDYQKLTHNCKNYALGIFKELGIIEAEGLSNFLIQRPHTHDELLQSLSGEVLSCPIKEELDKKVTSLLERINEKIKSIDLEDEEISKETISSIQKIIQLSNTLLEYKIKLGIREGLNRHFGEISSLLDSVSSQVGIKDVTGFKEELAEVEKIAIEVTKLSEAKTLPIIWKSNLHVAKRLKLDNFNPEEKAMYLAKIKINEVSDGLEQVLLDINARMSKAKSFERDLYLDLFDLKTMIKEAKEAIAERKQLFLKATENLDSEDLIEACSKEHKVINEITENLEKKVNEFNPRSEETSVFMRLINRIISYFKKDFITVENTQTLMKSTIRSLKELSERPHTKEESSSFKIP